ncbi:hypothetical protein PQ469_20425 [Mucilaginibacter sp. KACC 22773]|uniref:hypothetical protein n=1 Tax=Mucilaginibacter sp. KACC 22773 TaxID=3025671 RepID=UPI0023658AC5|nr:hypothetical protein [Mucilaginibacter sp. KACC 22773]WDF76257.1 hypothetical protein PQ469_20425 [Mucilaginibacter sp. KACC 22773]
MTFEIQQNIKCENCIKCGTRPQIEQSKKHWIVACPNKKCNNFVKDEMVNIEGWNRLNKSNANITPNQNFKKTA